MSYAVIIWLGVEPTNEQNEQRDRSQINKAFFFYKFFSNQHLFEYHVLQTFEKNTTWRLHGAFSLASNLLFWNSYYKFILFSFHIGNGVK